MTTLPDLPVRSIAEPLRDALSRTHVVLTAATGSGKTTLLPLLIRGSPWLGGSRILMLEPRRAAARMAARRMAALLGEPVGQTVGYQTRLDRCVGPETKIEVVTEGILVRRLQRDPELTDIGLLVFDEFHERSLTADLALALAMDVANSLREDLRLLIMSASLDVDPIVTLTGGIALDVPGRAYPVAIAHSDQDVDPRRPLPACRRAIRKALDENDGDILVFLPGRREIESLAAELRSEHGPEGPVIEFLFGDLPAERQDEVITGGGGRQRIVLSTDIAETSLTLDGVTAVVDSGLARKPSFDPNTGLSALQTRWISQASALQRAGRAGRQGPGRAYRCWTEARQARLEADSMPEIREADLAGLVLELAAWGVTSPDGLGWLDPPPGGHWRQALDLLVELGALDTRGAATAHGLAMVGLPCHPRLAHMLLRSAAAGFGDAAADLAALLSERDPLRGEAAAAGVDIEQRLDALRAYRGSAQGRRRRHDREHRGLDVIDRIATQFRRLLSQVPSGDALGLDAGGCLALAFPDRVAMRTAGTGGRYRMRNGRAVRLDPADPLCRQRFIAIAALDAGHRDGRVWLAAALDERTLKGLFAAVISETRDVAWDADAGDVRARTRVRLGALLLADRPAALADTDDVVPLLLTHVRQAGLAAFRDDASSLRARVVCLAHHDSREAWPDFTTDGLLRDVDQWLPAWLKPGQGVSQLRQLDLEDVLNEHLGWERIRQLDELAPVHWVTPAGSRRRIDYSEPESPVLAAPLQELLGLAQGPRVVAGQVALVLHLLSPAGRLLQVTSDLTAFWQGAYREVRKEMRGRYPKHAWPEDPLTATATRLGRRR